MDIKTMWLLEACEAVLAYLKEENPITKEEAIELLQIAINKQY